ncbi:probable DNA-directed RNA polymerase III subunit RPC6 [Zerene cesonia]|uniref:probable DNA-directed RNA polymerase III subunit RPC6 n=1 Tax=Zerene cesonia TaxID=33412 RepID=UPI0018E51078|nr:probable DNA-directed RNA polymerase III subunit RPC6 [Zerene cesonia]XP_038206652.1 probable DNA-directed RNA polymerase III subunit RPC6 [Zerene cesonia]
MTDVKSDHVIVEKIVNAAKEKPKGLTLTDMAAEVPELSPAELVEVINKLLQQGLIELYKQGASLIYKLKNQSAKQVIKGADNEEKVVYNLIEEAANKGIWIRDIRNRSNLTMTQLPKILKNLESKKLIKAVKSVNASKKKVYMLYNLEPDRSVSGGAWYQDQDFESEFVDILNRQCLRFLQQRADKIKNNPRGPIVGRTQSYATAAEVHKYITDLGISKVKLEVEDVITILNTLVFDGKAESSVYPDGSKVYRAIESLLPPPGLVQVPCGICPLIHRCSSTGLITPQECKYMSEWLEQ